MQSILLTGMSTVPHALKGPRTSLPCVLRVPISFLFVFGQAFNFVSQAYLTLPM